MPPAAPSAIALTETTLGRSLPSAFREFLRRSNGGEVECLELAWEVTPVEEIVEITEDARRWPSFPTGAISIADDGCGNHLIFLPSAADSTTFLPALFVWWHEGGELEEVGADFAASVQPREEPGAP